MAYRDSRLPSQDRPDNMRAECAVEPGPGVLVYVDDVAAGWCSIAPRASYRRLLNSRTIRSSMNATHGSPSASSSAPGYRRHGLMHPLLAGGGWVDVISGYVGTVELFERAGFHRAAPTTGRSGGQPRWVMRKTLC